MSYAHRNSLILSALLVAVTATGLYWSQIWQKSRLDALSQRESVLAADLSHVNVVVSDYDSTRACLDRLEARWREGLQVIPAADSPAATLDYLFGLQRKAGVNVPFDFHYAGRADHKDHSENRYDLEGKGGFQDLYAFLWQVEHGRRFCSVDRLEVVYNEPDTAVYSARWSFVDFRLSMRSYFQPDSRIETEGRPPVAPTSPREGQPLAVAGNPFFPLVTKALPKNEDGLLDVAGVRLRGVGYGLAFLTDRKGARHLLRVGDPVYLGQLAAVDVKGNRVVFELNKGGIWERRILEMDMNGEAH